MDDLMRFFEISIHPPREGWDQCPRLPAPSAGRFQSTHPVRGGTFREDDAAHIQSISIHPPREGWDYNYPPHAYVQIISIHPPREGWDCWKPISMVRMSTFQSTHPVRGGTTGIISTLIEAFISIHPPREGWDCGHRPARRQRRISIHPPREGWDAIPIWSIWDDYISIHPPREGWDVVRHRYLGQQI